MNDEVRKRELAAENAAPHEQNPPADRAETKDSNWTQFIQLCKCVGISAPLAFGVVSILSLMTGDHFFWWNVTGSFVACPLGVAFAIQRTEPMPFKKRILKGVGLAFLALCTGFLVVCGAWIIWVMFFFAS